MNLEKIISHRARAQRVYEEETEFFNSLHFIYKVDGEEYVELFTPVTIIKWLSIIPYLKLIGVRHKIKSNQVREEDKTRWAFELQAVAQLGRLIQHGSNLP